MSDEHDTSEEVLDEDSDPGNVTFRAGYLRSLANKLGGEDRKVVLRASRSLRAFHQLLLQKRT